LRHVVLRRFEVVFVVVEPHLFVFVHLTRVATETTLTQDRSDALRRKTYYNFSKL
jgi:hypothetical protein